MPVRTVKTYYVEHEGQEFETQHEPIEGSEKVTIKDNKAVVSYLADDSAQGGWYFDEYDQGRFINNDPRSRGEQVDSEELKELWKANQGRFFVIHKYEHGLSRYYRSDDEKTSATIPDKQWDVCHRAAFFIVPEDVPNPEQYCDSVMEEFTNWCNGDVYGVCYSTYTLTDGEWVEDTDEACWSYIGRDNAEQVRDEEHEGLVKEL